MNWIFMKKRIVSIAISLWLILIDQILKYFFYNLQIWNQTSFLSPLINTWISRWIQIPLIIVLFVSFLCLWIFSYLFHKKYINLTEFSLLIAWTVWNLIDRLYLHWVRDFISIGSFPVFNFADACLTCGVALILIEEIFHLQKKEKKLP